MNGARVLLAVSVAVVAPARPSASAYDPIAEEQPTTHVDLVVHDDARERDIPLRIYLPAGAAPAPVVLFSPGLGGSREGYAYLGEHWAARGYVVVVMQHPGSDDAVWRDAPRGERREALERATSARNFFLRVEDVRAVLDQLASWSRAGGHALASRLDLAHVGMSGHSFGAVTTQAVAGQSYGREATRFSDARIRAAIAMSPSSPRHGEAASAFSAVEIPWMLMTGTKDRAPIGSVDVASRLAVFPNLPPGDKYELVLDGAGHSAFSDGSLPTDRTRRDPNQQRAILALSTAFWDTYLRRDEAARAWLRGAGPRSVLEKGDRWQVK
jgi:predicted dienelactone hydrolase